MSGASSSSPEVPHPPHHLTASEVEAAHPDNWIGWHSINKSAYSTYISVASVVSGIISYPFFVLTTRQQAGSKVTGDVVLAPGMNTGLRGGLAKLGWAGLFRGALISQIYSAPTNLIYLSSTEYSREKTRTTLFDRYPTISEDVVVPIQSITSAVVANFLCMLPSYPANLVIAKMVIQSREQRLGFIDISKRIYASHGWKGFSHGFGTNFVYGTLMSTVWWWTYGHGRRICSEYIDPQTDEVYIDAASGLAAGLLSTLAAHPLDSVCSRIMTGATKSVGIIGATREIAAAEGFAVLWRGLAPSMAGTVVSSSIFALAYEFIKRASKLQDEK